MATFKPKPGTFLVQYAAVCVVCEKEVTFSKTECLRTTSIDHLRRWLGWAYISRANRTFNAETHQFGLYGWHCPECLLQRPQAIEADPALLNP
jgi:hypothetical protein